MSPIAGTFFRQARAAPGKLALLCGEDYLDYETLASDTCRLAHALAARGVCRGDHVGVVLHNCVDFVVLMLAASDLGLVLVPLPPSLPADARAAAFAAARIRHIVATPEALRASGDSIQGLRLAAGPHAEGGGLPTLAALAGEGADHPPPLAWGRGGDPYILAMTSGSTSAPKPIVLTQSTKFNRATAAIAMYGITAQDVTLAATPLYHSLAERLLLIPLLSGGTSVVMEGFSPRAWINTVRQHKISFSIAVSYQLRQIAQAVPPGQSLTSLRCVVSSSALLEIEAKSMLRARLGCALHECYGTSEIGIATSLNMAEAGQHLTSVGRPAPGVEIRILGADGQAAPSGTIGEIVCKTPMLFGGYFNRRDLTEAAMWGEYFRTGDLGRLDNAGYLHFHGRLKETIVTGGINVFPADIEAAVTGYPGLAEAAAFALPDDTLGEIVALAYVTDGTTHLDPRHLRRHCGRHLADFQLPRKFVALPSLPRNALGKLTRHRLPSLCAASTEAVAG